MKSNFFRDVVRPLVKCLVYYCVQNMHNCYQPYDILVVFRVAVCCFTSLDLVIIHMTRVDIKSLSRKTVLHPVSRVVFGINSVIQTLKRGQVGISQVPTAMDGRQIRKRSRRPPSLANSFGITYLGKGYGCVKQERAKAAESTQTLLFVFPLIHSNNRFIAGAEALVLNPTTSSNYGTQSCAIFTSRKELKQTFQACILKKQFTTDFSFKIGCVMQFLWLRVFPVDGPPRASIYRFTRSS